MATWDYICKFIIIGDSGVGKSNLMLRFTDNRYLQSHDVTIGVEFGARVVTVDGRRIKCQIWDTAGQESFRSVTRSYYRGATGCLLVFDIARRDSFVAATSWLADLREYADPNIAIVLVGNKSDLADHRQVSADEAHGWVRDHGAACYIEASAKSGESVEDAFANVAAAVYANIRDGVFNVNDRATGIKVRNDRQQRLDLQEYEREKRKCC